jgi:alpha-beta hydrolase superfamily lysophospholipase
MLRWIAYVVGALAGLYLALALALTFWPAGGPPDIARQIHPPSETATPAVPVADAGFATRRFIARDGQILFARVFQAPSSTTVLLVHGVGADGSNLIPLAELLRRSAGVSVVDLDLRGHGRSGGRPWSVAYAGQYEDDLADVLAALRKDAPSGKLVLAAHSMGGGIALRYALKPTVPVNGYLLMAPLLGGDSPTGRSVEPASGAGSMARFVTFRTPRLFGVLMFNLVGVKAFNDLPIFTLRQPTQSPSYGFAALQSMQPNAPKDYRAALGAIHAPLLVIAGSRDEAFNARAYPGVVRQYSHGQAVIIPDATHNSVLSNARAIEAAAGWLRQNQLAPTPETTAAKPT